MDNYTTSGSPGFRICHTFAVVCILHACLVAIVDCSHVPTTLMFIVDYVGSAIVTW